MPQPAMRVEGARTLRATLKAAGIGVQDLKDAHKVVADQVLRDARPVAPRRTGRLAASMRSSGTQAAAIVRAGGARVPYANPIHWGWEKRNIAPNRWLWETGQRTQHTWEGTYLAALEKIIDTIEGAPGP